MESLAMIVGSFIAFFTVAIIFLMYVSPLIFVGVIVWWVLKTMQTKEY